MKIDTLSFLNTLLVHTSPPSVFHSHVPTLVPPIEQAVDDPFYKITSEALLVTQQLVKVVLVSQLPSQTAFCHKRPRIK